LRNLNKKNILTIIPFIFFILSAYWGWHSYVYGSKAVAYVEVAKSAYTLEIKSDTPQLLKKAYKFQLYSIMSLVSGLAIQVFIDLFCIRNTGSEQNKSEKGMKK
jgi:hypothetical protein